jgi:hypothetical protein
VLAAKPAKVLRYSQIGQERYKMCIEGFPLMDSSKVDQLLPKCQRNQIEKKGSHQIEKKITPQQKKSSKSIFFSFQFEFYVKV